MSAAIEALLRRRSIAILGASADFQKLNGRTLKAMLDTNYPGQRYPVNPTYSDIGGLRCYADVSELPEGIDLAIVALPSARLTELGLNPMLCGPEPATPVDWLMVLDKGR